MANADLVRRRRLRAGLGAAAVLLPFLAGAGPARGAEDFVVSQAFHARFRGEPATISFLAVAYVVSLSSETFSDLSFTARVPDGFTISLAPRGLQEVYLAQPEAFDEELADGAYRMTQTQLGPHEATLLFYRVSSSREMERAEFPGLQIDYKLDEAPRRFKALDMPLTLDRYHRFSGSINDFIRRYSGLRFSFPTGADSPEWTFLSPDYRDFRTGFSDIRGSSDGEGRFRVQAGLPGDLRELLVRWEPIERGKENPLTEAHARSELEVMTRQLGDFAIDPESIKSSRAKLARLPAVVLDGRWIDNKPDRLGSGPLRLYALHDPRSGKDFYLCLRVQGRGLGPERANVEAPEEERQLLGEMVEIATTFRP